ncbi:MAG: 5-formyltetrahydrofolate cyclo-ligase [Treponema sp.]|nr:5-formyltetrahydrofolate cyclo-ligase [Treponema sp.]
MSKSDIRKEIKELINKNISTLANQSRMICQMIIESEEYKSASEIYAYMALPDEVDLTDVIKQALLDGKKVALPKIISKNDGIMEFFYLDTLKTLAQQTSNGAYGILEPDEKLPAIPDSALKTLILVPGRAFTKDGDRLGRGKGYYDRFLEKGLGMGPFERLRDPGCEDKKRLPNITVAGVCFDFQVLPELPTDPNDVKMDIILQG